MAIDYAALKSELQNNPTGILTGIPPGADNALAAALNATRQTINIPRTLINAYEIINATDPTEFTALSAGEKQRYQIITGAGQVDVSNPNIQNAFTTMFGAGTATRTALIALVNRKGSRAEQLFGAGTVIQDADIAKAKVS